MKKGRLRSTWGSNLAVLDADQLGLGLAACSSDSRILRGSGPGTYFVLMYRAWRGPLQAPPSSESLGRLPALPSGGALGCSRDPHGPSCPQSASHHISTLAWQWDAKTVKKEGVGSSFKENFGYGSSICSHFHLFGARGLGNTVLPGARSSGPTWGVASAGVCRLPQMTRLGGLKQQGVTPSQVIATNTT